MIDSRVNSEVESTIQKNLAGRIENFQIEITELSKATSLINMVEIQSGTPESGDSLHQLIELQYTASPKTRELVKANLSRFAKKIEKRNPQPNPNRPTRPRDLMGRITHYPNAEYSDNLWNDFRKMQELTGWNVQVFDTRAAINWCEQHKAKCDE